jgi:hypothetical protein
MPMFACAVASPRRQRIAANRAANKAANELRQMKQSNAAAPRIQAAAFF